MKPRETIFYPAIAIIAFFSILVLAPNQPVTSQNRERRVAGEGQRPANDNDPKTKPTDVVKVDVDLVTLDTLVLEKKTARIVGGLTKDDFAVYEDGVKQQITQFTQDKLPLSVLLLIDRGGCLDPFNEKVRSAAVDAISRLKPEDEVAVMTYHNTTQLLQRYTRDRSLIERALNHIPPHDELAEHCLNQLFFDAADYTIRASNPIGRRVMIVITGVTRNFDCPNGPSNRLAANQVYESGAVVCALIPKEFGEGAENSAMIWATRVGKLSGESYIDIENLANETGGEILADKPENLNTTFLTLMEHLRSRYNLAFVSTNKKRDGTTRKLRVDLQQNAAEKSQNKLIVKTRRSYIAPVD
jgi:VWFA-related protein